MTSHSGSAYVTIFDRGWKKLWSITLAVGSITSWNQYVGPTLGQCTPVACFNITDLRWVHYVWPSLDQRMPANLVLDKSLSKILLWPNVRPMKTGGLFLTRGPKGHISCTWVQCATFLRNRPRRTFLFTDWPEKYKLGRGCWDLASCQVSLNSVQWFQRRSRKCLSQSEARAAILFLRSARKTQTW